MDKTRTGIIGNVITGKHRHRKFIAAAKTLEFMTSVQAGTVNVRAGVRLIGYGTTRPVFVLPPTPPGYQQGIGLMVMFSAGRPGGPG